MNIVISIYRGKLRGRYVSYSVPYSAGMTVLDALLFVYRQKDSTLAFRYECRQAICGTCGVMLNGVPVLSCSTQLNPKQRKQVIGPLANFPIEKDLIVNIKPVLDKYLTVRPFLEKIQNVRLNKAEANKSKPFRKCIECGCCIAGSKTLPKEKDILDPMSLVKIARYVTDPRDGINRKRIARDGGVGKYSSSEAMLLTEICPRGVPIDQAIQILKLR